MTTQTNLATDERDVSLTVASQYMSFMVNTYLRKLQNIKNELQDITQTDLEPSCKVHSMKTVAHDLSEILQQKRVSQTVNQLLNLGKVTDAQTGGDLNG